MMNNEEPHLLEQVERRLRSDDPGFVDAQQQLLAARHGAVRRFRLGSQVVGLVGIAIGFLVLGLGAPAVLVAALAALGWVSTVHIDIEEGKR